MPMMKNINKAEVLVLKDEVAYQEGQVVSKTLAQNDALSITLFAFDKDEEIKSAIEKLNKEFDGNGRVLIRASGTEPLVRVMIEGEDQDYIKQKAQTIANLIEQKLGDGAKK